MAKEEQIKTSIDLTGEKEYRAACTNINSSLREIGSEMKLTTAEFADNADSVEALTAKQKLLQKQFDEQAKKAEAAEKALKKMRDNGIEPTNPAYQKMQTNLNNTKADMVKIQKEIDDTSKKLKSSKVDWESVGETVGKAGKAIGAACAAMGAAIAAAGAAYKKVNDEWLAENAKKEGVKTTADGLQYKIITAGNGPIPQPTDKVKVKYEGKMIDGTVFDSSYKRNPQTATFQCNQVIKGWTEALSMMPVGSKWELYIPQQLAYGGRQAGQIKPYSALIFTVELVDIEKPAPKVETTTKATTTSTKKKSSKSSSSRRRK